MVKVKKGGHQKQKIAIEHSDFYPYFVQYMEALAIRGFSEQTLNVRQTHTRKFIHWCDERGLETPQEITKPILESYQKHLYFYRQGNDKPLSLGTQSTYIVAVRQFFKWLSQQNYILYNPASELIAPKTSTSLPTVLSPEEVQTILKQPSLESPYGFRDRVILELLYNTGIRRLELCQLKIGDLNLSRGTLFVREGKGKKDRLLPLGHGVQRWLAHYLVHIRPALLLSMQEQHLFVTDYGEPIPGAKLSDRVKRYIMQAGIKAEGSCHLLRHAMATHMLENGADIRHIQVMLGHSSSQTTDIYTHVSIRKLQEIHAVTHPSRMTEEETLFLESLAKEPTGE